MTSLDILFPRGWYDPAEEWMNDWDNELDIFLKATNDIWPPDFQSFDPSQQRIPAGAMIQICYFPETDTEQIGCMLLHKHTPDVFVFIDKHILSENFTRVAD